VGIISAGFFNKKKAQEKPDNALSPVGPKAMAPAMSGAGDGEYVGVPTAGGRRR
jgi:hypothetical protein